MGDETKISIDLPPAAIGRFADAAQLLKKDGVPDVTPELLMMLVVGR